MLVDGEMVRKLQRSISHLPGASVDMSQSSSDGVDHGRGRIQQPEVIGRSKCISKSHALLPSSADIGDNCQSCRFASSHGKIAAGDAYSSLKSLVGVNVLAKAMSSFLPLQTMQMIVSPADLLPCIGVNYASGGVQQPEVVPVWRDKCICESHVIFPSAATQARDHSVLHICFPAQPAGAAGLLRLAHALALCAIP